MYISQVGSTVYGTELTDSSRYTVVGDSIVFESEGWGAEKIVYLDSLTLSLESYDETYGLIRNDFTRM